MRRDFNSDISDIRVILGPTNTGKTHLAIERMLAHESGMIGLPLRLLAREIYDRICLGHFGKVHRAMVALITGEEKIIPPKARFYICTTEAMPLSVPVAFLAVDEIQLAGDATRGHIFTDRLLHARGQIETMFMGAAPMRNIIRHLLPHARIETRARFSSLKWAGGQKLSRLPRRSAVTAFSIEHLYALGEAIKHIKGGAAIVMGALGPRTRNAQVAMYQAGEVDYLVATDAIGMGLNMDIDHVAFAQTHKFDGKRLRPLTPAELAQIAGRAGRHMNAGSFGITGEGVALDEESIIRIETHEFEPLKSIMWRNRDLDFSSVAALLASLDAPPPDMMLTRTLHADDMDALTMMSHTPEIIDRTQTQADIRLLWEVVQIPDFRKILPGEHVALLSEIFVHLQQNAYLPQDWLATQIEQCDRLEGDVDMLATRMAHIRNWTYITHKTHWVEDAPAWQQKARAVENRLSDTLHHKLTQKFVDRKTALLSKYLRDDAAIEAHVNDAQHILIGDEYAGKLCGLRFFPEAHMKTSALAGVREKLEHAARRALHQQAQSLINAADDAFSLGDEGAIIWQDNKVAYIEIEPENALAYLSPTAYLAAHSLADDALCKAVEQRLNQWVRDLCRKKLVPLFMLQQAVLPEGLARGLVFRLLEQGGNIARKDVTTMVRALDQPTRAGLRKLGVRFGAYTIFMPALLRPDAAHFLALAKSLMLGRDAVHDKQKLPVAGRTSAPRENLPTALYRAYGFSPLGKRVIRFDILERLDGLIRKAQTETGFLVTEDMLAILGVSHAVMAESLAALGYAPSPAKPAEATPSPPLWKKAKAKRHKPKQNKHNRQNADSPFSVLSHISTSNK